MQSLLLEGQFWFPGQDTLPGGLFACLKDELERKLKVKMEVVESPL